MLFYSKKFGDKLLDILSLFFTSFFSLLFSKDCSLLFDKNIIVYKHMFFNVIIPFVVLYKINPFLA